MGARWGTVTRAIRTSAVGKGDLWVKVVILCGGKGVRAFPFTEYLPKPMMPVGGAPILVQVVRSYIAQGYREFILAAGHHRAVIQDYFEGKDISGARIDVVDTGEETDTGGRIRACKDLVGDQFFATYADGLCDVSLEKLLAFHRGHGGLATITAVPLISQYGTMRFEASGRISQFSEKPVMREHWINAGFFVFDRKVFDHWEGENLERNVFPALSAKGMVYAYAHDGFFKSMDSYKDQREFEALLANGSIPWLVKKERG